MTARVIGVTSIAHFLTHFFMLMYPTIAVMQAREWDVAVDSLLPMAFPGFLLYGLGAIPVGLWTDRVGGWIPMVAGVFVMATGAYVGSLASVDTLWVLGLGLALVGLGASTYHPAGMSLITRTVKRSAWALGINGSFGSAAIALAPISAELLCEHWGWQHCLQLLALVAVAVGVLFLFAPIPSHVQSATASTTKDTPRTTLWSRTFVLLCVAMAISGFAYRGNTVVFPALFDARVSTMSHGLATTAAYAVGILMNVVGGYMAERWPFERVYLGLHVISLPFLVATAWLTNGSLVLVASLYAACAIGMQPTENSLVAKLSPSHLRGFAFGVKFTMVFGIGALAVPLVSTIMRTHGLTAIQLSLSGSVLALVGVVTVLFHRLSAKPLVSDAGSVNASIVSTSARNDTALDK